MGRPTSVVRLSERQQSLLSNYRNRRKATIQERSRITIILGAAAGKDNGLLSQEAGLSYKLIGIWRRRWSEAYDNLCEFEKGIAAKGISDRELLSRMLEILSDLPRSGHPKRITPEQEQQIVAMACRKPEEFAIPMTQWNREMLAHVAMAKGIVDKISPRYVSEILKKERAPTP